MNWCAVNTKPQKEDFAARQLEMKNLQVYLPKIAVFRKRGRVKLQVQEPLFPGYIFVRIDLTSKYVNKVNWTMGVKRLLCAGEIPVPVPDEAIAIIQQRLGAKEQPTGNEASLQPGTIVTVQEGAFAGLLGVVDRPMTGKGRVRVLLQFLGKEIPVECDAVNLDQTAGGSAT